MAQGVKTYTEDWSAAKREFAEYVSSLCAPPSTEPTEVWAEKHVIVPDGPFAGSAWRVQFTPFSKWIFEAMRKPGVKRVTLMMCAQYTKTTALMIQFLRRVKEDPADCMWVMAEADHMGEFIAKRLLPYIEHCDVVAPLLQTQRRGLIQFESMNLLLRGSNSRAKLQSDPIRDVYCDERREWAKGSIDLLRKRMRTFPNALEISAGTAGDESSELTGDYREGSQTRAHVKCLTCGHSQPLRFSREATSIWPQARECGGMVWETSDVTRPNGVWDYAAVAKTVRLECENPQCRRQYANHEKHELLRTMHPHDYNPSAAPEYKSFGGSAFEAIWESCDWDKLVVEFLKAIEEAKRGNIEPLRAFVTETLGEPWQEQLGIIDDFGFLEARKGEYDFGEPWPDERVRFMAADRGQTGGEHYWWLVRAYGALGHSRLVAYGKVNTLAELEEKRNENNVKAVNAMLDTGFKAQELYPFCLATGWKAFKGDHCEYYLQRELVNGVAKTTRRIWDRTQVSVVAKDGRKIGTVPLYRYADDSTKDHLASYMAGVQGDWTIPKKVEREYLKHLTSEQRREETDSRGRNVSRWYQVRRDNHWKDCEKLCHVSALITKLIAGGMPQAMVVAVGSGQAEPAENGK